ncbi:MAG TPA: carboxypeptidase-like regulatory domain-containing protein, partial [Bacteroidia bacterium]|nr:carboxypeptidase-like regulatory domain-containing protein [Bacteroidia bacterium]
AGILARVKNNLVLIDSLDIIILGTSTGVTLDTNLLRKTMTDIALVCANATFAYASSVNNNTLKALVNFPQSKLDGQKKDEVDDTCEGIYNAANTNQVNVTPFGAGPADAASLLTAIGLYRTAMQNPRQTIITKSNAILQLEQTISNTTKDLLKDQMDRMVNTLKVSNFNFWDLYFKAREIIDLGSTTGKVRGTVSDNGGNPLQNAVVSIRLTGTPDILFSDTTDVDGVFNISGIGPGNYDILITLAGFQPYSEINVRISAGEEVNRTITLLPV